jgi:hypothetical protein
MLERQDHVEENPYFNQIHSYGKVHLLENAAYLPLGFLAQNQLLDVNFRSGKSTFEFQNELFSAATGVQENVWTLITGADLSISGTGVNLTAKGQTGYCSYTTDAESNGTVVYKYIIARCIALFNTVKRIRIRCGTFGYVSATAA